MLKKDKPVIGISIGDINGIGPEIIIKALADQRVLRHLTPVIFGSSKTISYYRKLLKIDDFPVFHLKEGQEPNAKRVNIIECWEDVVEIHTGSPAEETGRKAIVALNKATDALASGFVDAVVTAPLNKATAQADNFRFPGHTEYLGEKFGGNPLMFMVSDNLRIAVATGHVPVKEVAGLITKESLTKKISSMKKSLVRDFGLSKPKIAVLGLNPHAGEEGLLGQEEAEIILPVIKEFKHKGNLVFGPFPADGFFGSGNYKKYDGILAMYHDQGLIPFKSLSFGSGVNFTANLPVVRTSPDHGTGYDLAGKGVAAEGSLRSALYLAVDILKNRAEAGE